MGVPTISMWYNLDQCGVDDANSLMCFRFISSLADCSNCMVVDDHLNVVPITSHVRQFSPVPVWKHFVSCLPCACR